MIVVSDLMGTLNTGSPVLGLVDWVRYNQSKWQARWYMASIVPGYLLAKGGLIGWQKWGQGLMIDSLSLIKDATPEKFDEVAEWIVEKNLWAKRRPDVIERLKDHIATSAKVYIASSVHQPGVEAFARRIGAQAIGTPVEFVNGHVRLASELVADEKKIEQVLSHLGVDRVDYAYGDTALDIPLLEHAHHPVAVYPENKLRVVAQERGWEIMGETTSYP
jgi:phosphoserine phosphatase